MTRSAALATAVVATVCAIPGTAEAQKPAATLSLIATPNPVLSGRDLSLSGRLTDDKVTDQKITLRSDPFPFDVFGNAGNATTNASGDFLLVQKPTVNTRYQARKGQAESAIVTVLVRPLVSLRLSDSTPSAGQRVRFSGRVCPEHDGSRIAIQRRSSTGFRTVRRATLRDVPGSGCSSWTRTFRVRRDGRYRAVIGAHADHIRGVSRTRLANAS